MLAFFLTLIEDENDRQLFERIYHSYRSQMMRVAVGVLGNETDAEDAVHETFCKVAEKHLDTVRAICDERDMRNYMLKAAKNLALNSRRGGSRRSNVEDIDSLADDETCISDEDFVDELCSEDSYRELVAVIRGLDPRYSQVLYLHFVLEMPMPEVAEYLDRKLETVKKQLVRGKALLAEKLKENGRVTFDD